MRPTSTTVRILAWLGIAAATGWAGRPRPEPAVVKPGGSWTVEKDVPYRNQTGLRPTLDVYLPRGGTPPPRTGRPAIMLVHGGSWIGGSKSDFRDDPRRGALRLIERGAALIAVDYRLGRPGGPSWPDALDDIRAAVRWVRGNAVRLQIDPDRIAVLGQGAGAHLAMLLGTDASAQRVGEVSARVGAVVSFYGPTDLESLVRSRGLRHDPTADLLGAADPDGRSRLESAASPIARVDSSASPMLIFHGSEDRWVPPSQSRKMAEALDRAGVRHKLVIVEGARHGFELIVEEPARRDLTSEIFAFLTIVWNASIDTASSHHTHL